MSREIPYPGEELQARLRAYIERTWDALTRDLGHLLDALDDTKVDTGSERQGLKLYVPSRENFEAVADKIRACTGERQFARIDLRVLPPEPESITEHGLLYLPGRYVVPGGRFNEFYGWDSYFIQRGLIASGRHDLADSMVDQALYEVEHYGTVLNANRTYYLTRSQPPVLSLMVNERLAVHSDLDWLRGAMPLLEKFYYYWRVPPHLNPATGLSRYHDMGAGPAPEVEFSERDELGRTHYERVRDHLRTATVMSYDKGLYYDSTSDTLTKLAYKADRSMRESGFDPTDRFGALNLDVIHYAPICLNVLLNQMELHMAGFHELLGDKNAGRIWRQRHQESAALIERYLWSEESGLYVDYHLRDEKQRIYPFLTTFWPLWAGLASPEQAAAIMRNIDLFLQPGGLQASHRITGEQWDAPFAWAPLQLWAVAGMERYGYHDEARAVARRFVAMVGAAFETSGVIFEKYDAVRCSAEVEESIHFGYSSNEPGFGWTNAVVLEFLNQYS